LEATLEQELCHHLGKLAPFVAVGQPGEWFAPEGGARVYLEDDSWQAVVQDLISRARFIVMHLVPGGWTWWECCQVLKSDDPTRILAVIVGDFFTDESYALLRQNMQQEFGIVLNEQRRRYEFICFDAERRPHELPLRYIPWPLFPFSRFRLSRSTFEPFLSRFNQVAQLRVKDVGTG
jgi:hypothetical protein